MNRIIINVQGIFLFLLFGSIACNKMPVPDKVQVKNGLRVILLNKKSSITSAVFRIGEGEIDGPEGLSWLTTDLLLRGTEVRNRDQLFHEIESLGGRIGAFTRYTVSYLYIQAPKEKFEDSFSILCECLSRPSFDEDQITEAILFRGKQKGVKFAFQSQQDIKMEDPLRAMLFVNSPLSRTRKDETPVYTRNQVFDYFSEYYLPANIILSISGEFNKNKILEIAESCFPSEMRNEQILRESINTGVLAETREQTQVSHASLDRIYIGYRAMSTNSEEFFSALILERLLASGPSSLLNSYFYNKRKYDVKPISSYQGEDEYGYFSIVIEMPAGQGRDIKTEVLNIIDELNAKGIPEKEFQIAKRKLISEFGIWSQFSIENAFYFTGALYSNYPYFSFKDLEQRIQAITLEEVQKNAHSVFKDPVVFLSLGSKN